MTNEPPTEVQLQELRETHGKIVQLESEGVHVVVAKPSKQNIGATYNRFIELASDPKSRAKALAGLFKSCLVYPDQQTISAILDEEPGLGASFGSHCTELLGIRDAEVKKS